MAWDAVKVPDRGLADVVLVHLGDRTGSVIRDSRSGVSFWLVGPGAADRWPPVRGVTVLGWGGYLAVPPADLVHPPGPHWLVPFTTDRCLTSSSTLLSACQRAAARARRDADLRGRLAEVNQRSRVVRPWG